MKLKALSDFPVIVKYPLSWSDMDIFGHVNSIKYFKYFENAHALYLEKVGFWKMYHNEHIGGVIKELNCNYLNQLFYPDNIEIGARISHFLDEGVQFEYFIAGEKTGLAAVGESHFVFYDYNHKTPIKIPEKLKITICEFDKNIII